MSEISSPTSAPSAPRRERTLMGLVVTVLGFSLFLFGAKPEWFGMNRSPVVGFIQIIVFELGLALLCLGGYWGLSLLWRDEEKTILADIGQRLVSTGYVVAFFTGMADIFGMGTQSFPDVPFFGPWQAVGVQIGQGIIAIGMLCLIPYHRFQKNK